MGRLYRCLRAVVRAVTPRMTTTWEEPFSGNPSIFVCNHVGAFGPIDMVVKFPLRDEVRVWCNEGIMNRKTCPAYVRQDYWWKPGCRLEPLYNATLPYIAAAVLLASLVISALTHTANSTYPDGIGISGDSPKRADHPRLPRRAGDDDDAPEHEGTQRRQALGDFSGAAQRVWRASQLDQHGLAEHLHDVLPRDGQEFDPLPGAYRPEEALL